MKDVERCKLLAREIEGLGPIDKSAKRNVLKSDPLDFQDFQHEISVKYPTFEPPKRQDNDLPLDSLPVRSIPSRLVSPSATTSTAALAADTTGGPQQGPNGMLPGTPAPSSATARPSQTRPNTRQIKRDPSSSLTAVKCMDPADSYRAASTRLPSCIRSICTSASSYGRRGGCASSASRKRVALAAQQTALGSASASSKPPPRRTPIAPMLSSSSQAVAARSAPRRSLREATPSATFKVKERRSTYDHLVEIEEDIEAELRAVEGDHMLAALDNPRHTELRFKLAQKRADVRRLQRVDQLYRAVLPQLQSSVIVLLKLLLATVTSINTNSAHAAAIAEGAAIDEAPPPTLEDVDVATSPRDPHQSRLGHLAPVPQWFKASHVMKFNYLSQVLVDSNVLLLILKIFGLGDRTRRQSQERRDNFRFFNYCYLNGGREARGSRAEDSLMSRQNIIGPVAINPGTTSPPPGKVTTMPDGTEIEVVQ